VSVTTEAAPPSAPAPAFRLHFGGSPGASSLAAWRCAARLAWREVRRRPGRTALVVALVMVPTLAMTVGVVLARTDAHQRAEPFVADHGEVADLQVGAQTAPDDTRLAAVLPEGSRWTRYRSAGGQVRVAGPDGFVTYAVVTDLPVADPVVGGMVQVRSGQAPRPGEVLVTRDLADRAGVGVGDTLRLARPAGSWRVSGVGTTRSGGDPRLVFGTFDWDTVRPDARTETVLVDLPGRPGPAAVEPLLASLGGGSAAAWDGLDQTGARGEVPARSIAWGWVAGVLGLVVVGIVVAAAFATSARRQLVTLGQLGAQGSPPGVVRRMLALQGWWTGLLGAALGAAVGIGAPVAGRGLLESLSGRWIDGFVVRPSDIAVIVLTGALAGTVAALVPARSAARVPVLTALNGRRPVGRVPRRLVPAGVVLFGGGTGLIALAVALATPPNGDAAGGSTTAVALVAVAGGLGVLFGTCCASPLAVDAVARVVGRLGGTARLAARSVGRARGRSAAVVTAIAVVGAVAVLVTTTMATEVARTSAPSTDLDHLPPEVVEVTGSAPDGRSSPLPSGLRAALLEVLPGSRFQPRRVAVPAGAPTPADLADPAGPAPAPAPAGDGALPPMDGPASRLLMADDAVRDLFGLSAGDRQRLDRVGVMVAGSGLAFDGAGRPLDERHWPQGPVPVDLPLGAGVTQVEAVFPQDDLRSLFGGADALVTEEAARRLGLEVVEAGTYVVAPAPLTDRQVEELDELRSLGQDSTFLPAAGGPAAPGGAALGGELTWQWQGGTDVPPLALQAAVVGGALLLTLLVVAMGLSLSATESRDERDVLVAVGARPRTLRRLAGAKAVVLAGTGAVLAVPAGLAPALVVLSRPDRPEAVPWVALALLVGAVPLVAGFMAWSASALATRLRPVRMSTFAPD